MALHGRAAPTGPPEMPFSPGAESFPLWSPWQQLGGAGFQDIQRAAAVPLGLHGSWLSIPGLSSAS